MEKRFEIREIWKDASFYYVLWDNEKAETEASGYATDSLVDLLNEQDQKIKKLEQSQNSKAIEELKKLKQFCEDNCDEILDRELSDWKAKIIGLDNALYVADISLFNYIDNQIKELGGEKNE